MTSEKSCANQTLCDCSYHYPLAMEQVWPGYKLEEHVCGGPDLCIHTCYDYRGDVWFIGLEIACALGLDYTRQSIEKLVDSEDIKIVGDQMIINESGLFVMIHKSPLRDGFSRNVKWWMMDEVLPNVRAGVKPPMDDTNVRYLTIEELLLRTPPKG